MKNLGIEKNDFQIQRTWLKNDNVIRHKTADGLKEYEELTLSLRGQEVSYIPYEAYKELLEAVKSNKRVCDLMIILF